MGITELAGSLTDNPYFGAGFGLFGLGALAAGSKRLLVVADVLVRRHYLTTVEVTCKDKSYQWLLAWITQRGAKKTQHLSVDTTFVESETGKISTRYDFQPSVGVHLIRHNVRDRE